jgi:2'-5' RNA ligase
MPKHESTPAHLADTWRRPQGIFVLAEIGGVVGDMVRAIQERFDPKLLRNIPPHVTLVGSSGLGPIAGATPLEDLQSALAPIAASTPPLELSLHRAHRFMQTDIIVLPLDPHGALRELHERIGATKLPFAQSRFTFTPHVTLSFFRTLTPAQRRELLAIRIKERLVIEHLRCSLTQEPMPPRTLAEFPLRGESVAIDSTEK